MIPATRKTTDRPPQLERVRRIRTRRRLRSTDLLQMAFWTSIAMAVGLYLASGGLSTVTDATSFITAVGIVSGLIGTDLVLVMLLIAARIPLIDRAVGQDVAMAFHRRLGKPALYLLLAHFALLTIGWALADGQNVIAETATIFTTPDMAIAYGGLGLLIVVVVSSLVAVRRRLPYETWHAIHLLSYAAVLVAIPHELSVGGILAEGAWQRGYWIALFVAAFGAIAWFRFAVPITRSFRHGIRVAGVESIAPGVVSVTLTGRSLDRLRIRGGQYAIWRFWSADTWWHAHPISFSAVPTADTARITVRALGSGTERLTRLSPGTIVSIEGPYGTFTDVTRTAPHLAIIAAGIGITPARALLEHSTLVPNEATVLLRGSDDGQKYLWDETIALAQASGSNVYSMVGPRPLGVDTWMASDDYERGVTLSSTFPDLASSDLYVCGPRAWSDLVVRDAKEAGLPDGQIHLERFDW
ncbi:ferredoxin reductase family protein [Agromyces sp. NPDC055520]